VLCISPSPWDRWVADKKLPSPSSEFRVDSPAAPAISWVHVFSVGGKDVMGWDWVAIWQPKSPKGVVDVGRLVSADRQKWRLDRLPNDGRQNWHEGHFFVGFFGSRSASSRSIAARMNAAIFSPGRSTASMRPRMSIPRRTLVDFTFKGGRPIRE
jgi:hypothetical protein